MTHIDELVKRARSVADHAFSGSGGAGDRRKVMSWNFRVFRSVSKELGEDVATYDIREAFYADDGTVKSWTASHCGPTGDTLESLINDIAWVTKAITLPVLDAGTGKEVEPAAMLADDLARIVNENPDSFPDIMQRAAGRG